MDPFMAYPSQSLHQFATENEPDKGQASFVVVRDKFLQVNLGGSSSTGGVLSQVLIKAGSMVAYTAKVEFVRQSLLEEGIGTLLKNTFITTEGVTLIKATARAGFSQLFLGCEDRNVTVLRLQGESMVVNGDDVLAFEPSVSHKLKLMKTISSVVSGGFYNVRLKGTGFIAFLTRGRAITLQVAPGFPPVYTDPGATLAWSGDLSPSFHTDFHFKQLVGRGSGDSFQMLFAKGTGFVVVQSSEVQNPR